jgi:hypothetical protein
MILFLLFFFFFLVYNLKELEEECQVVNECERDGFC